MPTLDDLLPPLEVPRSGNLEAALDSGRRARFEAPCPWWPLIEGLVTQRVSAHQAREESSQLSHVSHVLRDPPVLGHDLPAFA